MQRKNAHTLKIRDHLTLLKKRTEILQKIRSFFTDNGYLEVETPYVVKSPGEEVHLKSLQTYIHNGSENTKYFLHTSPELAMKRLVAATHEKIFQLARVWRNEEESNHHLIEFTMLEWYHPFASLSDIMDETEALVKKILPKKIRRENNDIHIDTKFERMTMTEIFRKYAHVDDVISTDGNVKLLAQKASVSIRNGETWEDLFFRLMLEKIDPYIGRNKPIFITDWPASQAALAKRSSKNPNIALRFELYIGGIELANAFEELTDPIEQKKRFEIDRKRRIKLTPEQDWEIDEEFINALTELPPCSGIAMGFDRLVMLALSAPHIKDVQWLL